MPNETAPSEPADPTLAVAERQLVILDELVEMSLAASRAFTLSAIAANRALESILADEYFTPEGGRAKACGARDAAESLQKVTRCLRLTLKMQMTVSEIVRDNRAGIVTHTGEFTQRKVAWSEAPRALVSTVATDTRQSDAADRREPDPRERDFDSDRLFDVERPDRFPHASVQATVQAIRADLGDLVATAATDTRKSVPAAANLWTEEFRRPDVPAPGAPAHRAQFETALSP